MGALQRIHWGLTVVEEVWNAVTLGVTRTVSSISDPTPGAAVLENLCNEVNILDKFVFYEMLEILHYSPLGN